MLARLFFSLSMEGQGNRNRNLQEVGKAFVLNQADWLQELPTLLCQGYWINSLNGYVVTKGTEISSKRTNNGKLLKIIEEERVSKIYLFHLFFQEEITGLLIIIFFCEQSVNCLLNCIPCLSLSKISYPFSQLRWVIHLSHLFPIKTRLLPSWPRFALYFLDLNQKSYRQATNRWKK